jgi:TrmH family RNA methyltransferase
VVVEPTPLSARNPRVTTLRRLTGRRRARLDEGRFVVEGPVPVGELLAAGAALEELYVDRDAWAAAGATTPLRRAVERAAAAGVAVWGLPAGVLEQVSDTTTPQGLLAVAARRTVPVAELAARPGPVLVLVDVADPGNAGTSVRAAEAAGAAGVVFAGTSTDPFGPKAVRAAAGSLLRVAVAEATDAPGVLADLRAAGRRLVATVAGGGAPPEQVDLVAPVAVLVGSEAHGLGDPVVAAADHRLTIPLAAGVESLNAAVAGAVVLFEAARQRRGRSGGGAGTDWTIGPTADRLGGR